MNTSDTDTAFFEMVQYMELGIEGIKELESIDAIKDELVQVFIDHAAIFEDVDTNNAIEFAETNKILEDIMNRYFTYMDGIDLKDKIVASGDTIILLESPDKSVIKTCPLSDRLKLKGSLSAVGVIDAPHPGIIDMLHSGVIEFDSDTTPLPMEYFSVAFVLENTVITNQKGDYEALPEGWTAVLPLQYDKLKLKRVIS